MVGVAPAVGEPTKDEPTKKKEEPPPSALKRWGTAALNVGKVVWKAARAFVFVVTAFAFWFLFVSLAKLVMRCELVTWWPWPPESKCVSIEVGSFTELTWTYVIILLTTMVVAIWAAKRLVFPPDD